MTEANTSELNELFAVAEAVADAARVVTMRHFRSPRLLTENKAAGHFDPVTIADRDAEATMRAVLADRRPDDGVLGEEHENTTGTSGLTWVLDPIDGTRGYISGTPTWGTLVSVRDEKGPILGLIDQPYTGERFIGGPGRAELLHGGKARPLGVAPAASLDKAILFSTFPEVGTAAEGAAFRAVSAKVQLTRYGTDCYAYALLAAGQIDMVIEAGLQAYDVQAPMAVIQAAGGIVTNWKGNSPADGGRVLAAASPALHQAALEILSNVPEN